jgi:hypothetical protein
MLAMSGDGSVLVACIDNSSNPVHVSTDGGATWGSVGMNATTNHVSITADGTYAMILAVDYAYGYDVTSRVLFREAGPINAASTSFVSGAMSPDGRRRAALGASGFFFYQSTAPVAPSSSPTPTPTPTPSATPSNTVWCVGRRARVRATAISLCLPTQRRSEPDALFRAPHSTLPRDVPAMCPRCARNVPAMCPRCARDVPAMCPR